MQSEQLTEFNQLIQTQTELTKGWVSYWKQYSAFNDWHFWFMFILFILPLIILYFFIDRRRMFHLGFFGFSVHVWHTYVDMASALFGKWTYPYKLIPFYPISFTFDASLIPVTFMLVYQWILNHKKDFYLYATLPAIFFGFIAKPLLITIDITKPGPGGGGLKAYFILFISHLLISYLSKWIADIFEKLYVKENVLNNKQKIEKGLPSMSWNWFRVRKKAK